jgi:hypothetical protein
VSLQRHSTNEGEPTTVPPIVHEVLRSPGQPLEPATRVFMESRFGHDFSSVRVHSDARAAESARAVNALAYTVGRDMVFCAGQYAPQTTAGRRLLAHELAHVAASGNASAQSLLPRLKISQSDSPEEVAADQVAERVLTQGTGAPERPRSVSIGQSSTLFRLTGLGCGKERKPINLDPDNLAALRIEQDYVMNINHSAETQYSIPEGTCFRNMGWADIVESDQRTIYDVKRNSAGALRTGEREVDCYVDGAIKHCGGIWKPGQNYFEHLIATEGNLELWAWLAGPGVIVWEWRQRQRQRQPSVDPRLILLLLAIMAAAAAVAKKAAPKQAGGPITAIIQILAAAAVIVLAERQAKAGEKKTDDDPLVALAQMLDETGHPMPPEIRKLIEEDPALRELLRIEVERRRRSGAPTSPDAKPGATTTPGTTSSTTGGRADGAAGAGTIGGGAAGIKEEIEPKPTPADRKAAAPSADSSRQVPKDSAGANESYWQAAQKAMDNFNWDSLSGDKAKAILDYPAGVDLATLKPKQELTLFSYGDDGQARYVFGLTVQVVARSGSNTIFRVKECYGLLTSSGAHLPPPVNYKAGTTFTATDHR